MHPNASAFGLASPDQNRVNEMNTETRSNSTVTAPQGLLSRKQVASLFGVCKETIRRWEQQGLFKPVIVNSRVLRYQVADIEAIIGRN